MDTIKVWPLTEAGKALRHPHCHLTFEPASAAVDGVEWPNDQFTGRRLADGDITDQAPAAPVRSPKPDRESA